MPPQDVPMIGDRPNDDPSMAEFVVTDKGTQKLILADRWTRLNAAIGDWIIELPVAIVVISWLGIWADVVTGREPPFSKTLAGGVLGFLGFVLIHGYFLKTGGQTIGKKLSGIRIVDLRGNVPSLSTLILARFLPICLAAMIPFAGPFLCLFDLLFIFRKDRRCLHDLIAGTQVVKNESVLT